MDTLARIWGRRAITFPLLALAVIVAVAGAPLWLTAAVLYDLVRPRAPLARTRAILFFGFFIFCEVWGVLGGTWIWLRYRRDPEAYLVENARLQGRWCGAIFAAAVRLFKVTIHAEGHEATRPAPFVLFVRHASTADTVLAAVFVGNPNRYILRYVLKRELLWDPSIDLVGRRLPNVFVDRTGSRRDVEVEAVAGLADNLDARSIVLIYPEGTRYTPAKHAAAVRRVEERGDEALAALARGYRHVLPPRLGGPLALLDRAPGLDVVVLEHTGFEATSSFWQFWGGGLYGATIHLRLRRIAAADIPREGRDRWLFEEWARTDAWIGQVTSGVTAAVDMLR